MLLVAQQTGAVADATNGQYVPCPATFNLKGPQPDQSAVLQYLLKQNFDLNVALKVIETAQEGGEPVIFSNVDPMMSRKITFELESIQAKYIKQSSCNN